MNENRLTMQTLHLNLKAEYFDQIADGSKTHEYRLCTPFWEKRLAGKTFDRIEVKKGYPKRGDPDRTIVKPWRGLEQGDFLRWRLHSQLTLIEAPTRASMSMITAGRRTYQT